MAKIQWKPGNMIYPLPAVLVSCSDSKGNDNIITVAWTGTICTNPPMVYISVKPGRYSYDMIKETKQFAINLTTEKLVKAVDYCGVKSGRDVDKFKEMKLTKENASKIDVPLIKESPVNIECIVKNIIELGSHHMFTAEVIAINVDEKYLDNKNKFHLGEVNLICYSHGQYYSLDRSLGQFGYSVMKKKTKIKKIKKRNKYCSRL